MSQFDFKKINSIEELEVGCLYWYNEEPLILLEVGEPRLQFDLYYWKHKYTLTLLSGKDKITIEFAPNSYNFEGFYKLL